MATQNAAPAVDVSAIQAMIAQSIAAAMAQVVPAPAAAAEPPKSKGHKAKAEPADAPATEQDSDGTATIDAKGIVSLHFQPVKWEKGKRAMSLRGSGERQEIIVDGLYNGRAMRFYVRGWLAAK